MNFSNLKDMGVFMLGLGFLIYLMYMVGFLCESSIFYPYAAEKANQECKSIGYTQYKSFERLPLSFEPMAVRCEK